MSIFEDWAKPFPKLRPVTYLITDNPYWNNIMLRYISPEKNNDCVIENNGSYFSKKTLRFIGLHDDNPQDFPEDFVFISNNLAGEFYQENIEVINKLHHSHPEYESIKIK